jgi:hypothetical protein
MIGFAIPFPARTPKMATFSRPSANATHPNYRVGTRLAAPFAATHQLYKWTSRPFLERK